MSSNLRRRCVQKRWIWRASLAMATTADAVREQLSSAVDIDTFAAVSMGVAVRVGDSRPHDARPNKGIHEPGPVSLCAATTRSPNRASRAAYLLLWIGSYPPLLTPLYNVLVFGHVPALPIPCDCHHYWRYYLRPHPQGRNPTTDLNKRNLM